MALSKPITKSNGVTLQYHRIVRTEIWTNVSIIIEVISYINQEGREQAKLLDKAQTSNVSSLSYKDDISVPYTEPFFCEVPYQESISVEEAYGLLKTLPEFEGAIDVLEEGQSVSVSG